MEAGFNLGSLKLPQINLPGEEAGDSKQGASVRKDSKIFTFKGHIFVKGQDGERKPLEGVTFMDRRWVLIPITMTVLS